MTAPHFSFRDLMRLNEICPDEIGENRLYGGRPEHDSDSMKVGRGGGKKRPKRHGRGHYDESIPSRWSVAHDARGDATNVLYGVGAVFEENAHRGGLPDEQSGQPEAQYGPPQGSAMVGGGGGMNGPYNTGARGMPQGMLNLQMFRIIVMLRMQNDHGQQQPQVSGPNDTPGTGVGGYGEQHANGAAEDSNYSQAGLADSGGQHMYASTHVDQYGNRY